MATESSIFKPSKSVTICDKIVFNDPVPFAQETAPRQIECVLNWFLTKDEFNNVLQKGDSIKNVVSRLEKMVFNGYLRIFDVEFEMLQNYMSETSWKVFLDFKRKRIHGFAINAVKCVTRKASDGDVSSVCFTSIQHVPRNKLIH